MRLRKRVFLAVISLSLFSREISYEEGEKFAKENEMLYVETSAKTGMNVEKTFVELGEEIYSKVKEGIIDLSNDVLIIYDIIIYFLKSFGVRVGQ